jgi:predicted nucleic acid-binding protein
MTKPTIYVETSVISYLTARLSNDAIIAAHQKLTYEWWEHRRSDFELYTSQLVTQEARRGDFQAAEKRWQILQHLPLLPVTQEVFELADDFVQKQILPVQAHTDALHIAVAIFHDMDYLLTWNCRHIANAEIQKQIAKLSFQQGYEEMPILCTPYELIGGKLCGPTTS